MMTGTPIESNVWMAYLLTVFLVVTGFAVYDILYRRVPDRALVFFIPLAALAPLLGQEDLEIRGAHVPFDGTYADETISGMMVLTPDLSANRSQLRRFLERE